MRRWWPALHAIAATRAFQGTAHPATQRPCRTRLRAQQNDGFDPRFGWFGLELGFVLADAAKQAVRGKTIVGDLVIAGTDNDKLKMVAILLAYTGRGRLQHPPMTPRRSTIRVRPRATSSICPCIRRGSIASPGRRLDECRPTRLREEIAEAAVLGIPGLFWVFVSAQLIEYERQTGRM